MGTVNDIICVGAVLWDVVGRSDRKMRLGHDVPGRITRCPGGVAMNVAMACLAAGMQPAILSLLGRDAEGRALAAACEAMGIETRYVTWSEELSTDKYMAIEAANGLIAAIADAHSLEAAGAQILGPLSDGALGQPDTPFSGRIALDGNLTENLLSEIAASPLFAQADLRVAPASPGKVARIRPLLTHPNATIYVNRIEAGLICDQDFANSTAAAYGMRDLGATRVLVTDGAAPLAEIAADGVRQATPPQVAVCRVTGAGDTFMANHIAAESEGAAPQAALEQALEATARYISVPAV